MYFNSILFMKIKIKIINPTTEGVRILLVGGGGGFQSPP